MVLPETTAQERILAKAALLRKEDTTIGLTRAIEWVLEADPALRAAYRQEQARGTHHYDAQEALETVAKQAREEQDDNPCVTIVKRATALQTLDPTLTELQAIDQVFQHDRHLYDRYCKRDPRRHPWPVVPKAEGLLDGDPLENIQKRLDAGETLDAIAQRSPQLWAAYVKVQHAGGYSPIQKRLQAP